MSVNIDRGWAQGDGIRALGCSTVETGTVLEEQTNFTNVSVTHGGKINAFGHA
jgi:hypothetical protein